jgi:SAM-dependent methyltransferase
MARSRRRLPVPVAVEVEDRHWWFEGRRRVLLDVVSQILAGPGRSLVVDVGCGTGALTAAIARRFPCVGVDASEAAVAAARERFPGVEFVSGPAPEALGVRAAEADLFVLSDVLQGVPDDRGLLAGLAGTAKPNARFLVTVPAGAGPRRVRAAWAGLPLEEIGMTALSTRLYPAEAFARLGMPPDPVNRALTRLLASESRRIVRDLTARRRGAGLRGAGAVAVLRHRPRGRADVWAVVEAALGVPTIAR